jgi:hypothetical protein
MTRLCRWCGADMIHKTLAASFCSRTCQVAALRRNGRPGGPVRTGKHNPIQVTT